jgi:hypothetical protein
MTKMFALAILVLIGLAAAARADPDSRTLYALHCMGCHQRHGEGHGTVPQLQGFVGNFLKVPGGREFLVQVPGVAQSGLTDAEIAAILNWTLLEFSRNELPENFRPYDGREVAGYRAGRLIDVAPVRARLLEEMRKRNISGY